MKNGLTKFYQAAFADGNVTENEIDVLLQKAEELGEDLMSFKKKLMEDYIILQIKKYGQYVDRGTIRRVVEKLGLNYTEYDMMIDMHRQSVLDAEEGKKFIEKLKNEIKDTKIFSPTGKYGKMELDSWETEKAKADLLLYALPTTPSEIYEYIQFINTFKFTKHRIWRKHVSMLVKKGHKQYPSNELIMKARRTVRIALFKRWWPDVIWSTVALLSIIKGLTFESLFGQILYYGLIVVVFSIVLMVRCTKDWSDYSDIFSSFDI